MSDEIRFRRPAEADHGPNQRRSGLGRALYERFIEDVRGRGARWVTAVTWPGTQNLYGTPAYPDYDAIGDDRVVFTRGL